MKNVMIFVLIMTFGFVLHSSDVQACPIGYSAAYFTVSSPFSSNCTYVIQFCYKCDNLGTGSFNGTIKNLMINAHSSSTDCGDITPAVDEWLKDVIIDHYLNLCTPPQCSTGSVTFTFERPICMQTINWVYYDQQGQITGHQEFEEPCLEYICVQQYTACWQDGLLEVVPVPGYDETIGTDNCLAQKPVDEIDALYDYVEWESECYKTLDCNIEEED